MKKLLNIFILLLICFSAFSQALDQFNGSLLIYSYGGAITDDSSDYRIQALYGDARGFYTGNEVLVGDYVFIAKGVQCAPYEITVVHVKGPLMDLELKDLTSFGQPNGAEGIITHLTPNKGYPMIPPEGAAPNGNGNPLRACVMDHLINLLDLLDEVADTDTIYAAYSKLQGEPIDSVVRILRNDTFPIYTSDPVIQIKGQNGLNSSTDTVKLGGVLLEQTYVNSYNPDDLRGYTMQFDYTGDGVRNNYIRLDSLGQIFLQTKDTAGTKALVNEFFQRNGRKYELTQISDDRSIWYENIFKLEDREISLINKDSTNTDEAQLVLKDALQAYLQIQNTPADYFRIEASIVAGKHRGIYLIDSTARNSNVVPGAVWTAVNNVGGGKWTNFSIDDIPVTLDSLFLQVDENIFFVNQSNSISDTLNFTSFLANTMQDGNGIYSGSDSLSGNTIINGKAYDLTFSSTGDIRFGDVLAGASGQLMTLRNDIGSIAFVNVDSSFEINGIELPTEDPTTKGFLPGNYVWYVDESGDNWNYANLDSLIGGSSGGGGSDGNGIYSGSGSLPGNVLVTGGSNNFTLGTTANVTLGDYPNDSYLRTVGGTNQIDIKGSGGTTINGIAYHLQDAQTGGKPAGTYLTTHNETGGNVSWIHQDSLPDNDNQYIDSLYMSGDFLGISIFNDNQPPVTVDLSQFNSLDNDPANEYNSSLSISGTTLEIIDGGGTLSQDLLVLKDSINTDTQRLSWNAGTAGNDVITISNGNSITITDNINDADSDPANEFQFLSYTTDTRLLSLSDGNSVSLPVHTINTPGLVPDGDGVLNGEFLREDGTFAIPADSVLTEQQVNDFVGQMVTGNTETGITVTYSGNKLNFETNESQTFSHSSPNATTERITITKSNDFFELVEGENMSITRLGNEITLSPVLSGIVDTSYSLSDSLIFVISGDTSVVVLPNNDNQNLIDGGRVGTTQTVNIDRGTGISFSIADSDSSATNEIQTVDELYLDSNNFLAISLENDGEDTVRVDLSSFAIDNQQIANFDLTTNVLTLEIENDGQPPQTVTFSNWDTDVTDDYTTSDFNTDFGNQTTDDLTEGVTNLYDQVVTISDGAGINITGTYPNFGVDIDTSTALNNYVLKYEVGTGIVWGVDQTGTPGGSDGVVSNASFSDTILTLMRTVSLPDITVDIPLANVTADAVTGVLGNLTFSNADFDNSGTAENPVIGVNFPVNNDNDTINELQTFDRAELIGTNLYFSLSQDSNVYQIPINTVNGVFSSSNQKTEMQVDTVRASSNRFVIEHIDTAITDFTTNSFFEWSNISKTSLPPYLHNSGFLAKNTTVGGSVSELKMYVTNSDPGNGSAIIEHTNNDGLNFGSLTVKSKGQLNIDSGNDSDILLNHPTGTGRIDLGAFAAINEATDTSAAGLLFVDQSGYIEKYSASSGVDKVPVSNGTYWELQDVSSVNTNGVFDSANEGGTTGITNYSLGSDLNLLVPAASDFKWRINSDFGGSNFFEIRDEFLRGGIMTLDAQLDSIRLNGINFPNNTPAGLSQPAGLYVWVYDETGGRGNINGHFPVDSLLGSFPVVDPIFLKIDNNPATLVDQSDGINDTIDVDSRVQYATSYMTGGNNGDIDTGTPEPLNLTTTGTIDTVIASTDFSVLSDGSIKFLGTTAFVTIDANVSTDIVGGAAEAVFYLTVNGVVQTSSRATVEVRGAYANANITYSASLAQNDTINIVGNADINNAIFNVDDWRLRVVKLR